MEKDGFTLIELMIVVFIMMILLSFGLVSYNRYKERAKAKELVVMARGCAADIISECLMEENGRNLNLENATFLGCSNRSVNYLGQVVFSISGCCTNFGVEAVGKKIVHYKGRCWGHYRERMECEISKLE